MARKLTAADNSSYDAIFASRRGTWLSPQNVRRQWRRAPRRNRPRMGYPTQLPQDGRPRSGSKRHRSQQRAEPSRLANSLSGKGSYAEPGMPTLHTSKVLPFRRNAPVLDLVINYHCLRSFIPVSQPVSGEHQTGPL